MQDLRLAFRQLGKSPGFTCIALLTLALGIGFSTSTFSVAHVFLLRQVPYPESERLVRVFRTQGTLQLPHTPANMLAIRDAVTSFEPLAIFTPDNLTLGEPGQPAELINALVVTADFLEALRVQPALGRGFVKGEDQPGQPLVALLTQRAWRGRYGGERAALGRIVRLNGLPFTIVGVLPASFDAPLVWGSADFVVPRVMESSFRTDRSRAWMSAVGRLKPGVTLEQASAELTTIAERLARDFPRENGADGLTAVALHDSNMDGTSRRLLWLMTGLSIAMLLIACANLASLQVARAFSRAREHAIRVALGGSRLQLMSPLLTESLLLAFGGGALGLLVASWTNDLVGAQLLINNEEGFVIPLEGPVFAFAAVAAALSGIAFGLAPAWLASRTSGAEVLKDGARSATAGPAHQRLKRVLLVGEMAIALALVGVAAAFGIGARRFLDRELGWRPDGLFMGSVSLPFNRYPENAKVRAFHRELHERVQAFRGVHHAALTTAFPFYSAGRTLRIVVDGQPPVDSGREPIATAASVTGDYFAAAGIPLLRGATFTPNVEADDPALVIVNDAFARRFWPEGSAIGRRIRYADRDEWFEIVGVVGDVLGAVRTDAPETTLQLYRPLVQAPSRYVTVLLRGAAAPAALGPELRNAVAAVDAELPVSQLGDVRGQIRRNLTNVNVVVANLAISAGLGLLIAALGLFGVMSQLTLQRTRDIGVRMALGANARDILGMIVGEAGRVLGIGVALGLPLLVVMNVLLRRTIPMVPLPGAWLVAVNILVLGATMILACWLPARRATQVDPVEALRAE